MEQIKAFLKHFLSQNDGTALCVIEAENKDNLLLELHKQTFKKLDFFNEQNLDGLYYLLLDKKDLSQDYSIFKQISDKKTMVQLMDIDNNYVTKHIGNSGLKLIVITDQETLKIADFTNYDFINSAGIIEYIK